MLYAFVEFCDLNVKFKLNRAGFVHFFEVTMDTFIN